MTETNSNFHSPYNLRKRNRTEIPCELNLDDSEFINDSDDDSVKFNSSSENESSSCSIEDSKDYNFTVQNYSKDVNIPFDFSSISLTRNRTLSNSENNMHENVDHKFWKKKRNKKISANNAPKVRTSELSLENLKYCQIKHPEHHRKERNNLFKYYQTLFPNWMLLLKQNFNILLYGLGSKQHILDSFRKLMLCDKTHVVINGFYPGLTLKQILDTITVEVLECTNKFSSIQLQLEYILNTFNLKKKSLYIVINNIEGKALRNDKTQLLLAQIANCESIHLIASFDHINTFLLWDIKKLNLLQPIFFNVTSFEYYSSELVFDESILVKDKGTLFLSSLFHVFKSLTPNARKIFLLIAQHQLESNKKTGMNFVDCYEKCREAFLINSDLTLRMQLTEFCDHKLLLFRKAADGSELLYIPLDSSLLHNFVESQ